MKTAIIYASVHHGNTKKIIDEIAKSNEVDLIDATQVKSYVIESTLKNAKSENLDVIFNKSITHYRSYTPGSDMYHKQYAKRMMLKGKINSALIRDYGNNKKTVNHFFDADKAIPIWAIFESLTLGEFGTFLHVQIRMLNCIHQQHCTSQVILMQMGK